jgi:hypothetical protein
VSAAESHVCAPVRARVDPGEDDEATDDRGRRWYHLRPKPRRRDDLMGFNSMLWMVVVWLLVVVVVVFPFPWWW